MLQNGNKGNLHSSTIKGKPINRDIEILEPAPMEKFNWLVHLQHVRGEINACKNLIKSEITRCQGKNEYVIFKQGIIQKQEGKIQEALDTFQKCLKLNPSNVLILKEVAKCLYDMKRFRLSLNAFLEVEQLSKAPDWQLYYLIAETYIKLGNSVKAKEYAHKSVKVGKQEESYGLLMKILISEKDFRSAVAVANAAIESCPDSVSLLTEAGLLYLKTGESQHAFERLSQALALEPTCSKALLGVGYITHKHEEYDVALSKYKIAVLYEPESIALWNNIGMCFYSKQKYIAAISCLKRGLWLAPLNWKLLFNLGLVHLATNQPASGFNFACAAVNLRSDRGECFALLGHTLFELKDTENALKAFKQGHNLTPSDPIIIANTALLSYLMGLEDSGEFIQKFDTLCEEGQNITQEVSELIEKLKNARKSLVPAIQNPEAIHEAEEKPSKLNDDEV